MSKADRSIRDKTTEDKVTIIGPMGLTKREYFAGVAMQGLLAHYGTAVNETRAVKFADAILKALEK